MKLSAVLLLFPLCLSAQTDTLAPGREAPARDYKRHEISLGFVNLFNKNFGR